MAHKTLGAEPDLRAQLLRWHKWFRRELSQSVDQLANREAYQFHGWELPDDHPARVLGVNINFVLAPTTCSGLFRNHRFVN